MSFLATKLVVEFIFVPFEIVFFISLFSAAKIWQSHENHFILRVNDFIVRVNRFSVGVRNFIFRVKILVWVYEFYFACILLIYSFGEISIKRLKTCEKLLPDVNPDAIATCSSFAVGSVLNISHACSMRIVLTSL